MPTLHPVPDDYSAAFWTPAGDGLLNMFRCDRCEYIVHPPRPYCPRCSSRRVGSTPVVADGFVYSYTINHQPWFDNLEVPYVVALVELDVQPELRVVSNVTDCEPGDVRIGLEVATYWDHSDSRPIPQFRPRSPVHDTRDSSRT